MTLYIRLIAIVLSIVLASSALFAQGTQQDSTGTTTTQKADTMSQVQVDPEKTLKRNFFQRILGKCSSKLPQNNDCWSYADSKICVKLAKAPELNDNGGAIRIEGDDIPYRVLIIKGDDGNYYAFRNECTHGKRRLDPVPGAGTVQCCSVGKSTFDYTGKPLTNTDLDAITVLPLSLDGDQLTVHVAAEAVTH